MAQILRQHSFRFKIEIAIYCLISTIFNIRLQNNHKIAVNRLKNSKIYIALNFLERLHHANAKKRQEKEFTTKHCMLIPTNLHQNRQCYTTAACDAGDITNFCLQNKCNLFQLLKDVNKHII